MKFLSKLFCVINVSVFSQVTIAADEYIIELYQSYCQACHVAQNGIAPKAFDENNWKPRLKLGLNALVNNAITGKGNMPAQGGCQECTYEDFEELILYMSKSQTELEKK